MSETIDYESTERRLRLLAADPSREDYDWCCDGADAIAALRAEVERLEAEDAQLRAACSRENAEICQCLGRALGYLRFCDDQKDFPGATDADGVCVGEHVAATIAAEAAERITQLETDVAGLVSQFHEKSEECRALIRLTAGREAECPPEDGESAALIVRLQGQLARALRERDDALRKIEAHRRVLHDERDRVNQQVLQLMADKAEMETEVARLTAEVDTRQAKYDELWNAYRRDVVGAESRPTVAVAVVVEDESGRILLLKRGPGGTWPGQFCLPWGRLDPGESLADCCRRELREETGLHAESFEFECVTQCGNMVGLVYRAVGFSGVPVNAEPDKHDEIGWFGPGELPEPLMPGVVQWIDSERPAWKTKPPEKPIRKSIPAKRGSIRVRPEFYAESEDETS